MLRKSTQQELIAHSRNLEGKERRKTGPEAIEFSGFHDDFIKTGIILLSLPVEGTRVGQKLL